jgi:hypothetical protein
MRRLTLLLCVLLLSIFGIFETAFAKRLALVIGNSTYEHVPSLKNPSNDASLMAASLEKVGFEVTLLKDQDQRSMKSALLVFGRKLKKGAEAGLIYYAGHGIEVDGRNFLVPVDSNTQSEQEADISNIELNDLMSLMENSGVPFNILVLDACRNNPFRGFRSQRGGLAPVNAPRGTYIAYSTKPGTVASDGDGDNSPFTQALAEQLVTPGLTIESVFKNTRSAVLKSSDGSQLPFDSSAIEGDFYFNPAPIVEPPKAAEPAEASVAPKDVVKPPEPIAEPPPPPTEEDLKKARLADAAAAWSAIEKSEDPKEFEAFIETYKETAFANLAEERLKLLTKKQEPAVVVEPEAPAPPSAEASTKSVEPESVAAKPAEPESQPDAAPATDDTPVTEPTTPAVVAAVPPPVVAEEPPSQTQDVAPTTVKPARKAALPAVKKAPSKKTVAKKPRAKKPAVKKTVAAKRKSGGNCFTFDGQRVCD